MMPSRISRIRNAARTAVRRIRTRRIALYGALLAFSLAMLLAGRGRDGPVVERMSLSDYVRAIEAGEVVRAEIGFMEAEIELRDGGRRRVPLPLAWQPREKLAEAGVAVSFNPPPPDHTQLIFNVVFLSLLALSVGLILVRMRGFSSGVTKRFDATSARKVTFSDVAGQAEAKEELGDIVAYLRDPERFLRVGAKPCRGALLCGPSGTGKTLLARALAGEAGCEFIYASGSDFVQMLVGLGSSRVRSMFECASKAAPCIIFVDEIDAMAARRSTAPQGGEREHNQTVAQLLTCMDGMDDRSGIVVIAATNLPDALDPALLRPGRFDRRVIVGLPTLSEREEILKIHARGKRLDQAIRAEDIARRTQGMSGADLEAVMNEAAIRAARAGRETVLSADMEAALDRVIMGAERRALVMSAEERSVIAFHEAGHAVIALTTPESDPLHKVTILPRGGALGMAVLMPDAERYVMARNRLLARLDLCYGGRAAEELIFGADCITNGAVGDLREASRIAREMVCTFGMGADREGRALAPLAWARVGADALSVSPETAAELDRAAIQIAKAAYDRVLGKLRDNEAALRALAAALQERETIGGEEARAIVEGGGGRPV